MDELFNLIKKAGVNLELTRVDLTYPQIEAPLLRAYKQLEEAEKMIYSAKLLVGRKMAEAGMLTAVCHCEQCNAFREKR